MHVSTGTTRAASRTEASRAKRDSEGTVAADTPKKGTKTDSSGPKFMSGNRYKG